MRRRITYANVVATLALVLAMSGGAVAATHYLLNSTKQINPKVLKKLRGDRGPRGYVGASGEVGPQGATGPEGKRGLKGEGEPGFSALSQLPSGKSESGDFSLQGDAAAERERITTSISFPIQLSAPIPAEHVEFTRVDVVSKNCTGRGTAARGWLCVYLRSPVNVYTETGVAEDPEIEKTTGTGTFGASLSWEAAAVGPVHMVGTYTVQAP